MQLAKLKKLKWDVDFSEILIKGRVTKGNILTKKSLKNVELKEKSVSTLNMKSAESDANNNFFFNNPILDVGGSCPRRFKNGPFHSQS